MTPQKNVKRNSSLYKICCLIPQQINEQDTVYLSSVSEINKFLEIHGIADRFRVDSGRSSTATCTDDLSTNPEVGQFQIIDNTNEKTSKETFDRQVQYNWKKVNSTSCHGNEIVPWHRCNRNDSLIHFCKKCSSSIHADNYVTHENAVNVEEECLKFKNRIETKKIKNLNYINRNKNCASKNNKSELYKNKTKRMTNFNRSLIGFLKKKKKKIISEATKSNQIVATEETNADKSTETFYDSTDKRVPLLIESVVYETTAEIEGNHQPGSMLNNNREFQVKEIKKVITGDVSKTFYEQSEVLNFKPTNDSATERDNGPKESADSDSEWLDMISDESDTSDCKSDEQNNKNMDCTFYQTPTKFIDDISESVMKRFIEEECDAYWTKSNQCKKIPKESLGIDKDLSTLFILKRIGKHQTSNCLLSHLTPRQKRLLAVAITTSLDEFSINGVRWGGLAREVLKKVCKIFKNQRSFFE